MSLLLETIPAILISIYISQFIYIDYPAKSNDTVKIFVYPVDFDQIKLPEEAIYEECMRDMYYMEILLPDMIRKSNFVTSDPDNADFFLVPHMSTCAFHNCLKLDMSREHCKTVALQYILRILNEVNGTYPVYFQRNSLRDHLIVLTWDKAGLIFGNETSIHETLEKFVKISYYGSISADPRVFDISKDIVIPPFIEFDEIIRWKKRMVMAEKKSEVKKTPTLPGKKKIFAMFRGTVHADIEYSKGTRQRMLELYDDKPGYIIKSGHVVQSQYFWEMGNSLYCICPPGWASWTPRMAQCMAFGAIPVVISADIIHPFETYLSYEGAVIKLLENEVENLDKILSEDPDPEKRLELATRIRWSLGWREECTELACDVTNPEVESDKSNPLCLLMSELFRKKITRRVIPDSKKKK